jgi:P-type E1-E2 ATPase
MEFGDIKYVVFDLNGTLSNYGKIDHSVEDLINYLQHRGIKLIMITSDQRNNASLIAAKLNIEFVIAKDSKIKGEYIKQNLEKEHTVAIGNARNDIPMFLNSSLSIVTLQSEGIHSEVIKYADIIVPSFKDALNLLLDKDAFEATMKK